MLNIQNLFFDIASNGKKIKQAWQSVDTLSQPDQPIYLQNQLDA